MINIIPLPLLSKMGLYDIEIHGANVKVSLVENLALVDAKVDEFRSSLQTSESQVVGLDIKFVKTDGNLNKGRFLLLCVGSHCLMIQLPDSNEVTYTLMKFLSDESICFLGTGMSEKVTELGCLYFYGYREGTLVTQRVNCNTGVEVGYLAAKILKKPNVEQYGLVELAGEVGMDIKEPISECPDWNAKVFSHEDVKYALHNAYTSYVIGNKVLDML
ncbi:hypothetical protein SO802_013819 [Lithocarpus litseifolius]|uniref:3'-5' exonuclease domain-containing protein n=1 Tax=Lithocarpus litseifolius TaxID=425828 RepID=A0AAW2D6M9_9ROSI